MQEPKQAPEIEPQSSTNTSKKEESPTFEAVSEQETAHLDLEERLREADHKAAEHYDAWLRAKAETENLRRRAEEDIRKASKFAGEKLVSAMLPVKDSLEAALANEGQSLEKLTEGLALTLKQLHTAFESAGISEENPLGQPFDPNKHQAISTTESDAPDNSIATVLQKGYLLHERIIRPALVIVTKNK